MLERFEGRLYRPAPGVALFVAGAAPTAEERSAALAAIAGIEAQLAPGIDLDDLETQMSKINTLNQSEKSDDPKGVSLALRDVLPGRSGAAFREAVRRIMGDEAPEDFSVVFRPTVPQLIRLTKMVEREWSVAAERLRRLLAAEEEEPPEPEPELTSDERADLKRRIAALGKKVPPPDRPAPAKLDGTSPAARVAAMTAARKAERLRQAEQPGNLGNVLSEDGQLVSETDEQAENAHRIATEMLLTLAEKRAQAERCACRGSDDYCPCQNVPDCRTRAERMGQAAKALSRCDHVSRRYAESADGKKA